MAETVSIKPKRIKADKTLQAKIGMGPLDQAVVEQCQEVMDNNDVDFVPLGMEYLGKLLEAISAMKEGGMTTNETVESLTAPVMQLKANASVFGYSLIGNLANVMLSFLEGLQEIDDDAIAIVDAHHTTLHAIVKKKMRGDGGDFGRQMEEELKGACKRYFAKRKK